MIFHRATKSVLRSCAGGGGGDVRHMNISKEKMINFYCFLCVCLLLCLGTKNCFSWRGIWIFVPQNLDSRLQIDFLTIMKMIF